MGKFEIGPAAEDLRPGRAYKLDVPCYDDAMDEPKYLQGERNVHFPLTYSNGERWLARVHLDSEDFNIGDASSELRACEAATLQAVAALAPEFVPAIHIARTQNGELPAILSDASEQAVLPLDRVYQG
jgi:hypothetical protein